MGSEGALVGAADWIAELLTGSIATAVATLAIATLGILMLTARLPARRGGQMILGCFILFSAGSISSTFAGFGNAPASSPSDAVVPQPPAYQPVVPVLEQKDPFGGAAAPPPQQDDL